jgi:hypothetical protein
LRGSRGPLGSQYVRYLGLCPADNPIVPTGLEPCREAEQGRRQLLEVAEADLELDLVDVKAPQACRKSLAARVDANDRAFRVSRWRRGLRRTRPSAPSSQ